MIQIIFTDGFGSRLLAGSFWMRRVGGKNQLFLLSDKMDFGIRCRFKLMKIFFNELFFTIDMNGLTLTLQAVNFNIMHALCKFVHFSVKSFYTRLYLPSFIMNLHG